MKGKGLEAESKAEKQLHLLLLITAKYAFICANRQSIKRIYIHLHKAAIIYAKRTLVCEFCIIFGIQLHFWSFNCAFGYLMKKINFHLREYLYHWRETKIQVRQSKVNSVSMTFRQPLHCAIVQSIVPL